MSNQVRVGGQWLAMIGGFGELEWSHAADGGCKEASWRMDLPPTFTHPALVPGSVVQIKDAAANVWQGVLTEPDVTDSWTFNAVGLSALAARFLCFDFLGDTTTTPDVAVDQAIVRGIGWKRPASLSAVPYAASDVTNGLTRLNTLLDGAATSLGKRWGVNASANVYMTVDPTVPTWYLTPGSGRFGLADDEYASDLFVRYVASGGGYVTAAVADPVARAKFGRREEAVDITSLGVQTGAKATAIGNGLLAKGAARQGWTNGLTVSRLQLTTPGGTPAHLPFVKAGELVRLFGVLNEQGQPVPYVDFVIGETKYSAGTDTIDLSPVGLVARNLVDVLSLGGAA